MTIDELYDAAAYMSVDMQKISIKLIQSKYSVDNEMSYEILEHLERAGIIVPKNIDGEKKVRISNFNDLEKVLSTYKPSIVLSGNHVIYKLIIWNDDDNHFDDVVLALEKVLNSNAEKAKRITLEAHINGDTVVATGSLAKLVPMRDSIQDKNIMVSILAIV